MVILHEENLCLVICSTAINSVPSAQNNMYTEMIQKMSRPEAQELVRPHVRMINQYQSIPRCLVIGFIGYDEYMRLEKDPIRRLGPTEDTVYPWNVVDYLVGVK